MLKCLAFKSFLSLFSKAHNGGLEVCISKMLTFDNFLCDSRQHAKSVSPQPACCVCLCTGRNSTMSKFEEEDERALSLNHSLSQKQTKLQR